jgi:hypothetical protein
LARFRQHYRRVTTRELVEELLAKGFNVAARAKARGDARPPLNLVGWPAVG